MDKKYTEGAPHNMAELLEIIHILRDPNEGCAWDSVQTHETLKKCLKDECEEVFEAIDKADDDNLCEELGDVMLQVLLNAEIASERGAFTFYDVVQELSDKLIRRHPHVFGDEKRPENPEEALALWKKVKAKEKLMKETYGKRIRRPVMTYEEVVYKLRNTFEHADARRIYEHIAFEIVIEGEASGVLYFEVANRACVIEPYNYYDNDGVITASAETLVKLANIELHVKDALESGLLKFRGNEEKMRTCIENLRLPGVEYDN